MFNEGKWAKLFCFIGLSFLPCVAKASLLSLATQDQQIQAACSRVDEPAQARLCHALLVSQQAEQRQRYLHFLLQQNIFSIQTYDFLWGEYQRTTACSEISRFFLSRALDAALPAPPTPALPPSSGLSEPPAVFALQESLN